MIAFGNDELKELPQLKDKIKCSRCGQNHIVRYAERQLEDGTCVGDKTIAFVRCMRKLYLVGVNGKEVFV